MHEHSEGATKGLRVYKIHRLHGECSFRLYLQYNLVLLFAIYKSLYHSRAWEFSTK